MNFDCPDSPEELDQIKAEAMTEPPALWRNTAIQCRQFYVALTSAGFSSAEAIGLVSIVIQTAAQAGLNNPDE